MPHTRPADPASRKFRHRRASSLGYFGPSAEWFTPPAPSQGLAHTYERNGNLVFEISAYAEGCRKRWADGKTQRVETMLSNCLAGLMLVARTRRIWQEGIKRRNEEWERQARERAEYKRLSEELDGWLAGWQKAKQIREFVAAVKKVCVASGEPTNPDSPRGQWIAWALRYADAFDPLAANEDAAGEARVCARD
jgi:hypothetical protein